MKKIIISLFLMLLFAGNNAQAATFTPIADIQYFHTLYPVTNYSIESNNGYLQVYGGTQYIDYGFMKFDLSSIDFSKEKIASASLKLFMYSSNGTNTTSLLAYNDSSWVSPPENKAVYAGLKDISLATPLGSLTSSTFHNMQAPQVFNVNLNTALLTAGINASELLTIVLKDITVLTPEHTYAANEFYSSDMTYQGTSFSPVLTINTAPVPEPSSMILGLMGLGSMLGFRRKSIMNLGIRTEVNAGK